MDRIGTRIAPRVLLVGPVSVEEVLQQCRDYCGVGYSLVVNMFFLVKSEQAEVAHMSAANPAITLTYFDPDSESDLIDVLFSASDGFEVIIVPYPCQCVSTDALQAIEGARHTLRHPLKHIGVPNDSVRHIGKVGSAEEKVSVHSSFGVHRRAVAEYVVGHLIRHFRGCGEWVKDSKESWREAHHRVLRSSSRLGGKTLGVLCASGRDGSAVAELALSLGMRVVCNESRCDSRHIDELKERGLIVLPRIVDVVAESECLSVHCATERAGPHMTYGMLGTRELEALNVACIVINTAGADLFEKESLFRELDRDAGERRLSRLILDMPFTEPDGRVDMCSENNARLICYEQVLITPRISGYTMETRLEACRQVFERIRVAMGVKG